MNRWTSRQPGDWRDHLITKNTFLDCPSPWVDADLHSLHLRDEANRPHSDPSSSQSSSMSRDSSWDSSNEKYGTQDDVPRRRPLDDARGLNGVMQGAEPMRVTTTHPVASWPVLGLDARNWTPGAEAHSDGQCRPCKFFAKSGACRDGSACGSCHLQHTTEPKLRPGKSARVRFDKMIHKLKERMLQDGDDFNLDNVEFVASPMKDDAVLRAKIVKKLVEVVEAEGGCVRGTEFSRTARRPAVANNAGNAYVVGSAYHAGRQADQQEGRPGLSSFPPGLSATGLQRGLDLSASLGFTRDLHCDFDECDVFSL